MYACIPEIDGGFFEGVCTLSDQTCISTDLPPPCHSWIAWCQSCLRLSRFLPLSAANVYSLLPYLVPVKKLQGGEIGHPPLPQVRAMHHPVCGLLRILLPRTWVNKQEGGQAGVSKRRPKRAGPDLYWPTKPTISSASSRGRSQGTLCPLGNRSALASE